MITDGADLSLSITGDVTSGELVDDILNDGGQIELAANVGFQSGGSVNVTGAAFFDIANQNGSIGSDATVTMGPNNLSTSGDLVSDINNLNGSIGGKATVTLNATGDVNSGGTVFFSIANNPGAIMSNASVDVNAASLTATGLVEAFIDNSGGTIGGDATVQIGTPGNVNTSSLYVVVNNSGGGSIGGDADIEMNVGGTATVTNDATVQILGNDPVGTASIEFNGGSYQVGGTFFNTIDGNGTITFNNASAHADVLKAGVFGTNGVLNVGGGTLSANTTLELYAPGSNGQLNFVSNVTLGGNGAKILAANSVTIFNNIVVTIGGPNPADIYTNHANYSGFGGNGTTTGTFAGAGANKPQPLSKAPPFGPSSSGTVRASTQPPSNTTKRTAAAINVSNTAQLLSLLDHAVPGPGGKITIPNSKSNGDLRNSNRLNADRLLRANHDAMDGPHMRARSASDSRMGIGKRIL
jgi:hypothetical protein